MTSFSKPSGLILTLDRLIKQSELTYSERYTPLSHGLVIAICVLPTKITLRIWRTGTTPSALEYQTVLKYLPAAYKPATSIEPVPYLEGARQVLSASWPPPQRLL